MRFSALLLTLLLAGCTIGNQTTHGNFISPRQVAALAPGNMSKDEVLMILGSPSSSGTMDANRWVYLSEQQLTKPFDPNQVVERKILILDFDQAGTLQSVTSKDQNAANKVVMDEAVTPTQGQALGIIDQMIQNVQTFGR